MRKPKISPTRFTAPVEELIGALARVAPLDEWEAAAVQQRIIKEKATALRLKLQAGQAELDALRLEYALTKNILGKEEPKS